jgi:hypothetical protein
MNMRLSNSVPRPSAVPRGCLKSAAMLAIEGRPVIMYNEIRVVVVVVVVVVNWNF